ncbi:Multiple inositol polyphosphate phosphatase 1 [Papilio xuthus]|uniref:Multiple inositol polyphosphate phosphatase 1 n=1 Tax=Papilio xuthus TaxID=66420 RepID=A0A194Q1Z1_PAPXU|nr:Multiple inositol polyphosphate phosphatase 1 [Papilio xuthus]
MIISLVLLCVASSVYGQRDCYWNAQCPYLLYSTKTPYDTIRGDIRDQPTIDNCQAVSIWSLHRHGNRNPGSSVTNRIKVVAGLKNEIIQSFENGRGQLCSQDIDKFRNWKWNETLEVSQSFLTGTGYEEIYDIAKRLRERYPHLLRGSDDDYYFRVTNEQRTVTSGMAFVHGLAEGTNLNLTVDGPYERDDLIRPYENCDRYQQEVKGGPQVEAELEAYFESAEYKDVQNNVQERLGIQTLLSAEDVYSIYEICRFYRSWTDTKQCPWCSAFSDQDLIVLEYRDDVRHYYRNAYGSWVPGSIGENLVKNLYENFEAAVNGTGKNIVSYFSHDTMMEMVYCALGLFKDDAPIRGAVRNPDRLWKTSFIAPFSVNIIAVLNTCQESDTQTYRVQFFMNELVTELCPLAGCTWEQFQEKFQKFTEANLDFCSMENKVNEPEPIGGNASSFTASSIRPFHNATVRGKKLRENRTVVKRQSSGWCGWNLAIGSFDHSIILSKSNM